MKTPFPSAGFRRAITGFFAAIIFLLIAPRAGAGGPPNGEQEIYHPAPDEFSALGEAVMDLLRSGDAAKFAAKLTASVADKKSIRSSNLPATGEDPLQGFQKAADFERKKVEAGAKAFLERAAALHLDFAKGDWTPRVIAPRQFGNTHFDNLQAAGETLPWTERVEFVLESKAGGSSTNGDFKLSVRGLIKYPGGWRSYDGIQWETFPNNVGDEKTRREVNMSSKIAAHKGFNDQDDPALRQFGETLVRFIRERDTNIFIKDALINADLIWAQIQKSGRGGPSRKELDEEFGRQSKEQVDAARAALKQMEDAGVDLENADIQITEAAVDYSQAQGPPGSLDGVMGHKFKLKLAVKSDGKAKSGTPLSGNYILGVKEIMRFGSGWKVASDLHWQELPKGILDSAMAEKVKFEDYIAEYGTLPPQTRAPDIEFITLAGERKMKLSDLKGKVVVLDFWATWCGPCQGPMAELQKLRAEHPDWKDRVAIVPVSIDDTIDLVRKHVDKHGWTNTFNVWADEGGWHSAPAKTFRVTGVPTTYIIAADGKIVQAGHAVGMQLGDVIDRLLKD